MEESELRLQDDLRGLTAGDVYVDPLSRAAYSCDASILQIRPAAVVAPRTASEAAAVVSYAADSGLSVHPRGGGTGLAGESLGPGIVLDFARYMNRILDASDDRVRVEPGVRFSDLQKELAARGRMIAPDPISGDRCTVGGMLATNAAGPHSLRYGTTRDHVLALAGILADGTRCEMRPTPLDAKGRAAPSPVDAIVEKVAPVLSEYAAAVQLEQPPNLMKHGGYELRGVLDGRVVHLPRLLAGAEGTLALAVEIELATVPIPPFRGMLLAAFGSLQAAVDAVVESLDYQPTACELLDRRLLRLACEAEPWHREWVPADAEALLLIEHEGNSADNVVERVVLNRNRLERVKRLASKTREVYGEPTLSKCWRMRDRAMPRLTRTRDNVQPTPFVENTAVPPQRLPEFLGRVQNIMKRHGVTATYSAHAGVGVLHARPLLDVHRAADRAKLAPIAEDMLEAVLSCGGTFNGEHGVGPLRSGLLKRQYPKLYPAFQRVKSLFDPHNVLNPGRIVGVETPFPHQMLRPLYAPKPTAEDEEAPKPQLRWTQLSVVQTAERCNGCAACLTTNPASRMCPTYRAVRRELSGPRAMANIVRDAIDAHLEGAPSAELREVADRCVYCKMCRIECPSSVDVSKLMLEIKANHVAQEGLSRTDWFFANWDAFAAWCSSQAHLANSLLSSEIFRWLFEPAVGLSRKRRLIRFQHHTFLRAAHSEGWTKKPSVRRARRKAAVFVDAYTNHQDPLLGRATVEVLQRLGIAVYVPPRQRASGFDLLQHADVESARARLLWNFEIAVELVREGYQVVATEPAAALMLRDEARNLVADSDLDAVAANTFEISEYLANLEAEGGLALSLAPTPITVGYHEPCRQRALQSPISPATLLRAIPDLRVVEVDLGCSGMAGSFGMREDGFETSMKAGAAMLARMAAGDVHAAAAQCGACRAQIEQGAGKPTLHPVKLLAVAAGLVPNADRLFQTPNRGLLSR